MTIHRRLRERNLRSRRPLRHLPLTPAHCRARLQWCMARSGWNDADWGRIVFSDESRFQLCPDDHRRRVWRRTGQRGDPAFTIARHTGPQQGIMVWGAISFDSRTPLVVIRGTLTAQRYVDDILRPVLLPFLLQCPGLVFQQANARPHTACVAMDFRQTYRTLPWNARSLSHQACLGYDGKPIASRAECWWPRSKIGANLAGNTAGDHPGALSVYATPCGSLYPG